MKLNIKRPYLLLLLLPLAVGEMTGCTGTQSFTTAARPGETVALAVGWQKNLKRQNMTVTFKDANNASIVYSPNDPRVRGVINLYPDPLSKVVVGAATGQNMGAQATLLANGIQEVGAGSNGGTQGDSDWWQTTILLDVPTATATMSNGQPIATGQATISIADMAGATILPAKVEILSGSSASNQFNIYMSGTSNYSSNLLQGYSKALNAMERANHSTVILSGDVIPYSVQMKFTHDPVVGTVKAWVTNPRGDLKSVTWNDDGTHLTVMVTPITGDGTTIQQMLDLKFYIAGGITNLTQTSLKAYDINGNPVTGVTASVTAQ